MLLKTLRELDELAAEWRALESNAEVPMLAFDWVRACAVTQSGELRVAALRKGGTLVAAAPLIAVRSGGASRLELAGCKVLYEPTDFCAADDESRAMLVTDLHRTGFPLFLERIPASSRTIELVRQRYRSGLVFVGPASPSPYLRLAPGWKEPESQLTGRRRYDLRRARRRAEEAGNLTVDVIAPTERDVETMLDTAIAVEAKSWKSANGSALAQDPVRGPFYRAYARQSARSGTLRIAFLRVGEAIAATQIAVEWNDAYWLLKIGYDQAWSRCSPGVLLVAETIRYAANRGLKAFEFLGIPEPWIGVWTTEQHDHVTLRAYPSSVRGIIGFAADAAGAVARRARAFTAGRPVSAPLPELAGAQEFPRLPIPTEARHGA